MNDLMTHELTGPSSRLTLYRRVLRRRQQTGEKHLPAISVLLCNQHADHEQLERYNNVCGFLTGRELPAIYPHILAFPLHAELMTDENFPFPLLGLVHIANSITRYRPLTINESVDISCRFGALAPHEKGTAFSILTEAAEKDALQHAARETWRIASNMGRRYGKASGDMNPIHLWPLTAKLFGFQRHIVHGMWTKARAVAALTPQIGARPFTVAVAFKLPLFLPAAVTFLHQADAAGIHFDVRDQYNLKPHLKGAIKFLD